jgi:hypothetical protein
MTWRNLVHCLLLSLLTIPISMHGCLFFSWLYAYKSRAMTIVDFTISFILYIFAIIGQGEMARSREKITINFSYFRHGRRRHDAGPQDRGVPRGTRRYGLMEKLDDDVYGDDPAMWSLEMFSVQVVLDLIGLAITMAWPVLNINASVHRLMVGWMMVPRLYFFAVIFTRELARQIVRSRKDRNRLDRTGKLKGCSNPPRESLVKGSGSGSGSGSASIPTWL